MVFERGMDALEALFRDSLAQDIFAACVSDEVERDATQSRAQRRHDHIEEQVPAIFEDIGRYDGIDRHAEQCGIGEGYDKNSPDPEMLQQQPDPGGVAGENVSDGFQTEIQST